MKNIAAEFERHYQDWKTFIASGDLVLSSISEDYTNNPHFQAIVDLGPDAVPYIIEKFDTDEEAHFLIHALERITNKRFTSSEVEAAQARYGETLGNQGFAAMWKDWWIKKHSGESKE
jgi:hypothetical protein